VQDGAEDVRRPWLVVGLGNPGERNALTPHNLGFLVADRLADRHGIRIQRKQALALVGSGVIASVPVVLAKPQTYMNRSGRAVEALLEQESLSADRLVLIYDELSLPWKSLRIRSKGSAGGHHGVESVIDHIGTTAFARLRLGIHLGRPIEDGAEFVLAPFRKAQLQELAEVLDYAAGAVEVLLAEGVEKAMAKFNRRAQGPEKEEE
jgi:PTH1 family peptidyl-tRNA hydrolase